MARKDIISGAVLLALSVAYYRTGAALPTSFLDTAVSSSTFPRMIGASGAVLSAILLVRGLLGLRTPLGRQPQTQADRHQHAKAAGLLLLATSYIGVFYLFGYLVAIAALFPAIAIYNGVRPGRSLVLASIGAVVLSWLFFVHLMGVRMPPGVVWRALGIA